MVINPTAKEEHRHVFYAQMKIGNVELKGGQKKLEGYESTFINMAFYVISEYENNRFEDCIQIIDSVGSIGFRPGLPLWIRSQCELIFYIPVVNRPYSKHETIMTELSQIST